MGLDMYLTKKVFVGAEYEHRKVTGNIDVFVAGEKLDINFNKVFSIEEASGYWRKANAIHQWFVDNVQEGNDNCGTYYVSEENLQSLLDLTNEILADHSKANDLLPAQSGFFFGGTEYDEWYFENLVSTKEILENALKSDGEFYYHSSW